MVGVGEGNIWWLWVFWILKISLLLDIYLLRTSLPTPLEVLLPAYC